MGQVQLSTAWDPHWQPEFIGTVVFVQQPGQVLLIHKKTGHGAGRINGPGGKIDPGEDVLSCARRELIEEVGLVVSDPVVAAELRFVERDGPQWLGFAVTASRFSGELIQTREANPFWCDLGEIPYDRMWPDDAVWLPRVLAEAPSNQPFVHDFLFRDGELLEHTEVDAPSIWRDIEGPV